MCAAKAGVSKPAAQARRGGGRKARRELRLAATPSKAVEPGQPSGRYRPLSDRDIERIHHTALDVLEKIGVAGGTEAARELFLAKGCRQADNGRICFPRALIEQVIADACRSFVMYGRDPRHDIELAGQRMHFGISGAAVTVLDYETRGYRPATITDLYDFARLVDQLEHIHRYGRLLYATDLEDEFEHDVSMVYANMAGTQKHFMLPLNSVDHLTPVIDMFDLVLGGEGRFRERPFGTVVSCPVVSPLTFGHNQTEISMAVARAGTPITIAPAPQSGATAPAALAGTLVQTVAEGLAIIALLNFVHPGHPACMVLLPFVSDLRSGAFTGGGGEEAVLMAAAAQIGAFYDLPTGVSAGMTDSKLPDNQAGHEKGVTVAAAALAGANVVGHSAGTLATIMGCSYEAMVIDNDMLGNVQRLVRGIEVTDETLSFDAIREATEGPGHYLGHNQTLELMEREYLYPKVSDRGTKDEWQEQGAKDVLEVAHERVRELLSTHFPTYIEPKVDALIRERYPIRLPSEAMRADCGRWTPVGTPAGPGSAKRKTSP